MLSISLFVFSVLGLIIGSFLNVVIYRFNTQRTFGGRSGCMVCLRQLRWYELVPVASYLFLRGRCGGCRTKISTQYPIVELITGAIFGLVFFKLQILFYINPLAFAFTYAYYVTVFSLLLVIAVYDLRHKIIPNIMVFIFVAFAFIGMFFFESGTFYPHIPPLMDFLSGFIMAFPFAFMWFISRGRWMGFGDAKLALGMGFLLGIAKTLSAFVIAFWSGAIIGILLISLKRIKGVKTEIPFAPFLVLGTLIAFLFDLHLFPF